MSPDVEPYDNHLLSLEDIYFLFEFEIGEYGVRGADVFGVMVVTPEGLRKHADKTKTVLCERNTLVVSDFSWNEVKREIERIVESCQASTMSESVLKLQRFFHWEYEDYIQDD